MSLSVCIAFCIVVSSIVFESPYHYNGYVTDMTIGPDDEVFLLYIPTYVIWGKTKMYLLSSV